MYLKAAWTQPFPEGATADAPFYPDGHDRPGLTVPMMHLTAPQAYLRGDGYQAVLLPTVTSAWRWPWCCPTGR